MIHSFVLQCLHRGQPAHAHTAREGRKKIKKTTQNNTERDMDTLNVNTIHLKCSGKVAETSVSHMLTSGAGAGFRMC